MASAEAARVLDRFYRGGNGSGYGLGLAIVREVARAIDAKVSIATEPGAGTTIALELERAMTK